jgi:hypothetical protein
VKRNSIYKKKRNEVIKMELKGWPFESFGSTNPCGGEDGFGPGTPK